MIKKDSWVRIKRVILEAGQRAARLPEETRAVPFVMWDKGFLLADAELGDTVTVRTRTGRLETGLLLEADPQYQLGYGSFVPELLRVSEDARRLLWEPTTRKGESE